MSAILKKHEAYLDTVALETMKILLMRNTPTDVKGYDSMSRHAHKIALAMLHSKLRLPEILDSLPVILKKEQKQEKL